MDTIGMILQYLGGLGSLICFILVVVKMFQNGSTLLGILSLLLCWCVGPLVAFIMGWVKNAEWGIKNIMIAWTACIALGFVGGFLAPSQFSSLQQQIEQQIKQGR